MPGRDIPIVNGEVYHILNRGVAAQPIFNNKRDYQRFLTSMLYYQNRTVPLRFSKLLLQPVERRIEILTELAEKRSFIVEFIAYCLMPNHFHFLLRQVGDDGIAKFISNLTNSYARYYNVKNKRVGSLFQGKFKAVRIETDRQLVHVARYIHLNPYSSYVVKKIGEIVSYSYSSLPEYLKLTKTHTVLKEIVLSHFKTLKSFREFTFDQADYQRRLQELRHLVFET